VQTHEAVKRGDVKTLRALLAANPSLANARSETDARGTYPLHVAAEFGQADAAKLLLEHGADVSLLDAENDASALCWAAFFAAPKLAKSCLEDALGGVEGQWTRFSDASLEDWRRCVELLQRS
jgi:ankyrin repeat protein